METCAGEYPREGRAQSRLGCGIAARGEVSRRMSGGHCKGNEGSATQHERPACARNIPGFAHSGLFHVPSVNRPSLPVCTPAFGHAHLHPWGHQVLYGPSVGGRGKRTAIGGDGGGWPLGDVCAPPPRPPDPPPPPSPRHTAPLHHRPPRTLPVTASLLPAAPPTAPAGGSPPRRRALCSLVHFACEPPTPPSPTSSVSRWARPAATASRAPQRPRRPVAPLVPPLPSWASPAARPPPPAPCAGQPPPPWGPAEPRPLPSHHAPAPSLQPALPWPPVALQRNMRGAGSEGSPPAEPPRRAPAATPSASAAMPTRALHRAHQACPPPHSPPPHPQPPTPTCCVSETRPALSPAVRLPARAHRRRPARRLRLLAAAPQRKDREAVWPCFVHMRTIPWVGQRCPPPIPCRPWREDRAVGTPRRPHPATGGPTGRPATTPRRLKPNPHQPNPPRHPFLLRPPNHPHPPRLCLRQRLRPCLLYPNWRPARPSPSSAARPRPARAQSSPRAHSARAGDATRPPRGLVPALPVHGCMRPGVAASRRHAARQEAACQGRRGGRRTRRCRPRGWPPRRSLR